MTWFLIWLVLSGVALAWLCRQAQRDTAPKAPGLRQERRRVS